MRENKANPAAINTIMPPRTCQARRLLCSAPHQSQSPQISTIQRMQSPHGDCLEQCHYLTHALINWISTDKIKTIKFEQRFVCVSFLKHVGHTFQSRQLSEGCSSPPHLVTMRPVKKLVWEVVKNSWCHPDHVRWLCSLTRSYLNKLWLPRVAPAWRGGGAGGVTESFPKYQVFLW